MNKYNKRESDSQIQRTTNGYQRGEGGREERERGGGEGQQSMQSGLRNTNNHL